MRSGELSYQGTMATVCCWVLIVASLAYGQSGQVRGFPPSSYQAMAWRNIGPFRGGRCVAVAGVRSDPRTYYFGGVGGGVYKTSDAGQTWTNITDSFLGTSSVGAIAVAPSDPNVIYLGMGEYTPRAQMFSYGDGVYKSTDAGHTWVHLGLTATREISRIVVDPANPGVVYVAAQGTSQVSSGDRGVYRSKDGGASWQKVLFVNDVTGPADLAMDPSNGRILYAAMWDRQRKPWYFRSAGPDSGIYKSEDSGDSWQKIDAGLPANMGRIGIAVSAESDRLYAIVEDDPKGGLYRSDDAGKSWTLINDSWDLFSRGWYYARVTADPNEPNAVWVMNSPLFRSGDGGRTFKAANVHHSDTHELWINPDHPEEMILGDDGGAEISQDGGSSWSTEDNQPTGQFYRVNTDQGYPYHVYGAQQDDTTVDIASAVDGRGIMQSDWHPVGGGESGFVAFDPKDTALIYAGDWGGQISEFDPRNREALNVMAYPKILFGTPLRELKYRFNYNAPLLVSQHDPAVIYHAAQRLLRSDNRGVTWKEISPDLTDPKPETQGDEGGPYWDEGEIYDTITYVAESPHDKEVLWTGSDDGVVGLTRDGGLTWKRFSLPDIGNALVNAIEVSPFEPATAYVAASRYKFDDYRPYIFRTSNFGQTWRRIDVGIPAGSWCHVVREDPVRKGLLYAGTETGVSISFDDGEHWQSLQLNLPNVPVSDLQIHGTDLVASTVGRAFWILDDITPLRQMDEKVASSKAFLFPPRPAFRTNLGVPHLPRNGSSAESKFDGTNAPRGAILDFYLTQAERAKIEILDASGHATRTYSSQTGAQPILEVHPGLNRVLWDLRRETVAGGSGSPQFYRISGRLAKPGQYTVRLTAGDDVSSIALDVRPDPRIDASAEEYTRQDEMLASIENGIADIYRSGARIDSVRSQLHESLARTDNAKVIAAGKALDSKLEAVENATVHTKPPEGQRFVAEPPRLVDLYIFLHENVNQVKPEVTDGVRDVFRELSSQWALYQAQLAKLLGADVDAFNKLVSGEKTPAIVAPK